VALDQLRRHARRVDLDVVGVGDDRAAHVLRGPRPLGQPRRQQAARARLGGRDRPRRARAVAAQQRHDLLIDGAAVVGEQGVGVAGRHERRERLIRLLRVGLIAGHHLDLAPFQARRDLQSVERDALALGHAQRFRDLRLGNAEHAQCPLHVHGRARDRRSQCFAVERRGPHGL
jgi:hypothetical protein